MGRARRPNGYFNIATGMRFNIHGAMLGSVPAFLVSTKGLDFLWPPSSWIYRAIVKDAEILEREIEFAPGVGKVKSGLNKSVSWRTISSLFSMERIEGKFLPYDILRKNANEDSRFDEKGKIKGRKKIPRENYLGRVIKLREQFRKSIVIDLLQIYIMLGTDCISYNSWNTFNAFENV